MSTLTYHGRDTLGNSFGNLSIEPLAAFVSATLFSIGLILFLLGLIYLVSLPWTWKKKRTIRQAVVDFGMTFFWVFVATTLFDPHSWMGLQEYLQIRPLDILLGVMMLTSVLCMFNGLTRCHSIFMWSPMSFIMHHLQTPMINERRPIGSEKPTLLAQGQFDATSENPGSIIHLMLTNAITRVPAVVTMAFALPLIVRWEEEIFRGGTDNWTDGIIRSVLFGLMHFVAGFVPLGAAIALSLAGIVLTQVYMTAGLDAAVTLHLAYDSIVFLPLMVGILYISRRSTVSHSARLEVQEA